MGASSSKVRFSDCFSDLLSKEIDPSDHEFWDELWKAYLSVDEVFELITPTEIKKLIAEKPENLKTLFTQGVIQLYQVVETPFPQYFEQATNCIRILSRIIPVLVELCPIGFQELLWSKRRIEPLIEEGTAHGDSRTASEPVIQEAEPLAVILINTIYHLLFLSDFSIDDPGADFVEADINTQEFKNALMWTAGVGCTEKTVLHSTQYDSNRTDLLRLMIAVFCDPLYQRPDQFDSCSSLWLEVATSADAPFTEIVFYSLINTVLGYDPIGWGMPYGNLISTDSAKTVVESAIQVLLILLDYGYTIKHPGSPLPDAAAAAVGDLPFVANDDFDARGFNVFRRYLGQVTAPDQLNFLYRGFLRLLNNAHQVNSTYLPYSITKVDIEQELLVLLWKCIDEMPSFVPYILKQSDITNLLIPICYFMIEGRKDPSKVGMIYLCTFTLLRLSGERSFGVALNKPYELALPVDIPLFTGSHADLLIVVLHKLIVSGSGKLTALYNCFLTIICNISPYCKTLCSASAVKLINMFQLFSAPAFFFAAESNYTFAMLLIESFNNMIQYQYEGHSNLIYAIIRRHEIFEKFMNVSLTNVDASMSPSAASSRTIGSRASQIAVGGAAASSSAAKQLPKSALKNQLVSPTAGKEISVSGLDSNGSTMGSSSVGKVGGATDGAGRPSSTGTTTTAKKHVTMMQSPSPSAQADDEAGEGDDEDDDGDFGGVVAADREAVHAAAARLHSTEMVSTVSMECRAPPRGSELLEGDMHRDEHAVPSPAVAAAAAASRAPHKHGRTRQQLTSSGSVNGDSTQTPGAGPFVPTVEWLATIKSSLPMHTIARLLQNVIPQVELMLTKASDSSGNIAAVNEQGVIDFIKTTTMVGLLPVPHPIVIRKYQPNKFTAVWFTAFQWGVIFMHNLNLALFDGSKIKLFSVHTIDDGADS